MTKWGKGYFGRQHFEGGGPDLPIRQVAHRQFTGPVGHIQRDLGGETDLS